MQASEIKKQVLPAIRDFCERTPNQDFARRILAWIENEAPAIFWLDCQEHLVGASAEAAARRCINFAKDEI